VITGMSGAGKSQAMSTFEDDGWFCIDNLPPRMLPAIVELAALEGNRVERVAVACDVRGGHLFDELSRQLDLLAEREEVTVRVVFLEASNEVLLNRFRETRRRHPLGEEGGVLAGITQERELLEGLRERANVVIDSSDLNIWDLRRAITDSLETSSPRRRLAITFVSFGFKHGVPRDVDLMFDVRFLTNPHYIPGLAPLTGRDQPVIDYLSKVDGWDTFLTHLTNLLDFLIPAYGHEGKRHLVVAFGCTGGRHRSVRLAELMSERYRADNYDVSTDHRDIHRSVAAAPVEGAQ
jgi:UPF0042 nucleotide-binding protein